MPTAGRPMLYSPTGEVLMSEVTLHEEAREVLMDSFALLFKLPIPEWDGRGGREACAHSVFNRIILLCGKDSVEKRFDIQLVQEGAGPN